MYDHHFHTRKLQYYQFCQHSVFAAFVASFQFQHISLLDVSVKPTNSTANAIAKIVEKAEEFAGEHGVQPWLLATIVIGN